VCDLVAVHVTVALKNGLGQNTNKSNCACLCLHAQVAVGDLVAVHVTVALKNGLGQNTNKSNRARLCLHAQVAVGDLVAVHVTVALESGEVIDSTFSGQPLRFRVGSAEEDLGIPVAGRPCGADVRLRLHCRQALLLSGLKLITGLVGDWNPILTIVYFLFSCSIRLFSSALSLCHNPAEARKGIESALCSVPVS